MARIAARIQTALSTSIREKLGVCSTCIRLSILLAGLAWAVVLVAASILSITLAVVFTTLAVAHLAAFGLRSVRRGAEPVAEGCTGCSSRRGFLRLLAGAVPLVFLARYLAKPSPAGAQVVLSCAETSPPGCGGTCDLFDENGDAVAGAVCVPHGQICRCEYTNPNAVPGCHRQANGRCGGKCPPLFRSKDDAKHGRHPITGRCEQVTGVCRCVYRY